MLRVLKGRLESHFPTQCFNQFPAKNTRIPLQFVLDVNPIPSFYFFLDKNQIYYALTDLTTRDYAAKQIIFCCIQKYFALQISAQLGSL